MFCVWCASQLLKSHKIRSFVIVSFDVLCHDSNEKKMNLFVTRFDAWPSSNSFLLFFFFFFTIFIDMSKQASSSFDVLFFCVTQIEIESTWVPIFTVHWIQLASWFCHLPLDICYAQWIFDGISKLVCLYSNSSLCRIPFHYKLKRLCLRHKTLWWKLRKIDIFLNSSKVLVISKLSSFLFPCPCWWWK